MTKMKELFARITCAWTGHTRGRRISPERVRCARCGTEWDRAKRKKREAAA